MNKFFSTVSHLAALAATVLACGGVGDFSTDDSDSIESTDDSGELGTVEQAMNIGNGGYGFSSAASRLACAQPGGVGQVCAMPRVTSIHAKYCFTTSPGHSFSAADKLSVQEGIALVDNSTSVWDFAEVAASGAGCQLRFIPDVNSANPGTTNIDNFVTYSPSGTITALTSPAGASHVNGSWSSFTVLEAGIDRAKIVTSPGLGFVSNLMKHYGGNATAKFLGLGSQTGGSYFGSPTKRAWSLTPYTGLTAGEVCRIDGLNTVTSPATVSATFACGT